MSTGACSGGCRVCFRTAATVRRCWDRNKPLGIVAALQEKDDVLSQVSIIDELGDEVEALVDDM